MPDERAQLTVSFPSGVKPVAQKRIEAHEVAVVASPDPLRQAWSQGIEVDRAWMNPSAEKPLVQRIGFSVLSVFYLGFAIAALTWALASLRNWREEGVIGALFLCVPALIFGYLGVRGLWSALRIQRKGRLVEDHPSPESPT